MSIILVNLIINMQFHPKKKNEDKYLDLEYCFLRVISPLQGHFNSLLENNKFGIISCSPFCSPKESSPRTVGVEGGGGGVSWKLYKFWSSSHLFLHSWTMQHCRKRPRNYGLIMVSIMSAWSVFDLFWFKLVECEGGKQYSC